MEGGPLEEQVSMHSLHMTGGLQELQELHDYSFNLEPSTWTLFTPASNARTTPSPEEHTEEENPTPQQCHPPPPSTSSPPDMAYGRADPGLFAPLDMPCIQMENRVPMVRAVASRRPPAKNEDLTIVNIAPLPANMLDFNVVREVLLEFLVGERGIAIMDIQPCLLGQAYVRFACHIDRDNFVLNGPYPYQDVHFTFTKHNEGRGDVPTSTLAPGLFGVGSFCRMLLDPLENCSRGWTTRKS